MNSVKRVYIPIGVTARVFVPRLSAKADLVLDGGSVQPVEKTARHLVVALGAGRHRGALYPATLLNEPK